ncbi:interferon lambda-3-like [Theropithecus gelada]|uniref:Interferon lambda-3-like n=1 Tax=Theropithecus gelada TaxID=9565 RepID=A0A8D2EA29_THEGE|nr:interferon lambda-3-like [Theropithecus gelada]
MKLDMTGGCMPVLVLMVAVLTVTGAVPVARLRRALPDARGCHIAQFKSLSPQELQAFKRAKDALEESLLLKDSKCRSRLFPRTWDLRQLQVTERPVVLEAELALTLKVLEAAADADSALVDVLDQPLHTLHHILSQLRACIQPQLTAGSRPRGRLHHWLHRLQEAPKKESPGCLEASVTFNLFRLLTRDLKCVASGDLCV